MKMSEALKSLLENVPDKSKGICENMEKLGAFRSKSIWESAIENWPLWENDSVICPVEGCVFVYLFNLRKWDKRTTYGKRRYNLLNHLIKFYEERGE